MEQTSVSAPPIAAPPADRLRIAKVVSIGVVALAIGSCVGGKLGYDVGHRAATIQGDLRVATESTRAATESTKNWYSGAESGATYVLAFWDAERGVIRSREERAQAYYEIVYRQRLVEFRQQKLKGEQPPRPTNAISAPETEAWFQASNRAYTEVFGF